MKKLYSIVLGFLIATPAFADISIDPLLNKITLQLNTEQWVTTKTALVDIAINAAVADKGIEKVQNEVMQKLSQLSKAEWHIVSYDRQLDKSGLESIQMIAQARLEASELGNLRDKAKAISIPGDTLTVDNVQFTPSEEEIRQANVTLRNNIYQQAKMEIDNLNKTYTDQKYYLHSIDFVNPQVFTNNMYMAKAAAAPVPRASSLTVGNKQVLQATVVIAALSDQAMQKLVH